MLIEDCAGKLDGTAADALNRIRSSAVRMDSLICDLLGYDLTARQRRRLEAVSLDANSPYSGNGIDLALVQKGVERMGGHVGLSSVPGKGSTFWIELPVATAHESSESKPSA